MSWISTHLSAQVLVGCRCGPRRFPADLALEVVGHQLDSGHHWWILVECQNCLARVAFGESVDARPRVKCHNRTYLIRAPQLVRGTQVRHVLDEDPLLHFRSIQSRQRRGRPRFPTRTRARRHAQYFDRTTASGCTVTIQARPIKSVQQTGHIESTGNSSKTQTNGLVNTTQLAPGTPNLGSTPHNMVNEQDLQKGSKHYPPSPFYLPRCCICNGTGRDGRGIYTTCHGLGYLRNR